MAMLIATALGLTIEGAQALLMYLEHQTAKKANEIAKEANAISERSNEISRYQTENIQLQNQINESLLPGYKPRDVYNKIKYNKDRYGI